MQRKPSGFPRIFFRNMDDRTKATRRAHINKYSGRDPGREPHETRRLTSLDKCREAPGPRTVAHWRLRLYYIGGVVNGELILNDP